MATTATPEYNNPPPDYRETVLDGGGQARQQRTYAQPYQPTPPTRSSPPTYHNYLIPKEMQPNDYLILSVVVAIVCGILNVLSLFCTIPAVISSGKAFEKKYLGQFKEAKSHGNCAAICIILSLLWVMVCGMVIVGFVVFSFYHQYFYN